MRCSLGGRSFLACGLLLFLVNAIGRAGPLPPDEQRRVNKAISDGVVFLKKMQGPKGWTGANGAHPVGHTALVGLTLLECGEPPNSQPIQHAVQTIRGKASKLTSTYEISLAILLLDRYGAGDKRLIQMLAMKLAAGQTATGGWGYKCPDLSPILQQQLLVVLHRMRNHPHIPPEFLVKIGRPDHPGLLSPGKSLEGVVGRNGPRLNLPISLGLGHRTPGIGTTPGESPGSPGDSPMSESGDGSGAIEKEEGKQFLLAGLSRRDVCIRSVEVHVPANEDEPADEPAEPAKNAGPIRPVPIPPALRHLPVLQDPRELILADQPERAREPMLATTDNSNTQFAILALWAAQRHGTPVVRSLNLLALRFCTSQNADGSWSYHYRFGGGPTGTAAMNVVGLLGLAVGHGLAHDPGRGADEVAERMKDPLLLHGFAALSRHIGQPVLEPGALRQPNLYYLWSLERAGVLYNLDRIGGKDWYRWGTQCLLANQQLEGNWQEGGYHGSNPVLDTCLALLFLKRANLAVDLAIQLPFQPEKLNKNIELALVKKEAPSEPRELEPTAGPTVDSEPEPRTLEPVVTAEPDLPVEPETPEPTSTTIAHNDTTSPSPSDPPAEKGGKNWLAWLLVLLSLVLLGVGALLMLRKGDAEEGESTPRKRAKRARPKMTR